MAASGAAVIFDVDGTLVDSNDAHARAWVRAFTEHGITVDARLFNVEHCSTLNTIRGTKERG